ncbi:MAG: hypothetical protein IPJ43_15605 [Saprospiraceae bacterium]|nr:hypothetical protein [Saprospiraceae bacterium]
MKQGAIIAFVALATSLAVYSGVGNNNKTKKQKLNVATNQFVVQVEQPMMTVAKTDANNIRFMK